MVFVLVVIAVLLAAILWRSLSGQGKLLVKSYGLIAATFIGIGIFIVVGFFLISILGGVIKDAFHS